MCLSKRLQNPPPVPELREFIKINPPKFEHLYTIFLKFYLYFYKSVLPREYSPLAKFPLQESV